MGRNEMSWISRPNVSRLLGQEGETATTRASPAGWEAARRQTTVSGKELWWTGSGLAGASHSPLLQRVITNHAARRCASLRSNWQKERPAVQRNIFQRVA
ncbi:hypothetical protein F503_02354 [Ophiostoma piceae UAMH 11346]|uniref:Uncharacterized protein n=1 Tax=Ophiostoma piceae (strain UAMH 11346) TaxID=1262450 RepID=S3CXN3_OPHP1|nr:hypothetical protein F503_02354 [Ophiostoma piceae UAMH 11346]